MPTLALWDIDDAQRFCRAIVSRSRLSLSPDGREDLEAYLVAECWNLSRKYDPSRGSFSTFAGSALRLKIVDWQRQRYGRTTWRSGGRSYIRARPQVLSLDALDDQPGSELGRAQPGGGMGDDAHRLAAELRSLDARGRRPPGRDGGLG